MIENENKWLIRMLLTWIIGGVLFFLPRGNAADTTFSNNVQNVISSCHCLTTNVLSTNDLNPNDIPIRAPIFVRGLNPNLFMLLNPKMTMGEMRPGDSVILPASHFNICRGVNDTNTLYLENNGRFLRNIQSKLRRGSYAAARSEKLSDNVATRLIVSTSDNLCVYIAFEDSIIVSEKFYEASAPEKFSRWKNVLSVSDEDLWLLSFFLGNQSEYCWTRSSAKRATN